MSPGILFKGAMVRSVLDGSKSQTRRTAGLDAINAAPDDHEFLDFDDAAGSRTAVFRRISTGATIRARSRYGMPGDTLWVRESFGFHIHAVHSARDEDGPFVYAADPSAIQYRLAEKWTPSIHMPRWASRIDIQNLKLGIERLCGIIPHDSEREGASCRTIGSDGRLAWSMDWSTVGQPSHVAGGLLKTLDVGHPTARHAFLNYVNEIHGGRNWRLKPSLESTNPFVWVLHFKRLKP